MKIVKRFSLLLVLCCSFSFLLVMPQASAMGADEIAIEESEDGGSSCYVWQPQCEWCACTRTKCKAKPNCGQSCQDACDFTYTSCVGNNNCP
jgi:hypothetical protein